MGNIPFGRFGIEPTRTLDKAGLRGKVRARFLLASMRPPGVPDPDMREVRWSDDYQYVFISKASGLIACGFNSLLFEEHQPVAEAKNWAIYHRSNPAACSLLHAIEGVVEDHKADLLRRHELREEKRRERIA